MLLLVCLDKDSIDDLKKAKSNKGRPNRQGLVQQIVTYTRDGKTVTRMQWVRSEFEKHSKKDEEEKKEALLNERLRERKKNESDRKKAQMEQMDRDSRESKKAKDADEDRRVTSRPHKPSRIAKVTHRQEVDAKKPSDPKDDKPNKPGEAKGDFKKDKTGTKTSKGKSREGFVNDTDKTKIIHGGKGGA